MLTKLIIHLIQARLSVLKARIGINTSEDYKRRNEDLCRCGFNMFEAYCENPNVLDPLAVTKRQCPSFDADFIEYLLLYRLKKLYE